MSDFTHFNHQGRSKMVDVGEKPVSQRVAVAAGWNHVVGLRRDGTVLAAGSHNDRQCDTSGWQDIMAIAAGNFHTLGLRKDGKVLATGLNDNKQCDVKNWNNVVAVAGGWKHSVALCNNGKVLAVGRNVVGQCDTELLPPLTL